MSQWSPQVKVSRAPSSPPPSRALEPGDAEAGGCGVRPSGGGGRTCGERLVSVARGAAVGDQRHQAPADQ